MIEINKNPSKKELWVFGLLLILFAGLVGGLVFYRWGSLEWAGYSWIGGGLLALLYFSIPSLRRPIYLAWMYLGFPIGWAVSHLFLGLIYYGVLTPVGLLLRVLGYDSLKRRMEPERESYWIEQSLRRDAKSYFRQF